MNYEQVRELTNEYINEMKNAIKSIDSKELFNVIEVILNAYKAGNKVIVFGNGGSGNLASHLVQDLAKHTIVGNNKAEVKVQKRFKALCLNECVSCMTTWANDVGYDKVYSEQLINWVEPWDVVIGITGSGNTPNVINALEVANAKGAVSVSFTGGGKVLKVAQYNIVIKDSTAYCVEDALSCVVHLITDIIRNEIQK